MGSAWLRGYGWVVILLLASSGVAAAEGDRPRIIDTNNIEPVLGTSGPWRRLGDSEFRLAWPESGARPFCFSGDGQLIAGANRREVRIWRFPRGELVQDLSDAIDSDCIAFSADGRQLLALEQRQLTIHCFDVASGKLISQTKLKDFVDEGLAPRFFFSDDATWLVATAEHAAAWDTATGDRRLWLPMEREWAVAGQGVLLMWGYKFVDRYDLATGKQLSSVRRVGEADVAISNTSGTVMAGYSEPDRAIVFYDPVKNQATGGKILFDAVRDWGFNDGMISADGRRFVTWRKSGPTYFEREVVVYDVATGKLVNAFPALDSYLVEEPAISPDGKYVFLAGGRVVFSPIEVDTGKSVRPLLGPSMDIGALSFTPDGNTLVVGSRDKCQAWDVTKAMPGTVFDDAYQARSFAAVDNKRVLMCGSSDEVARLQDIGTGAVLKRFGKDGSARFGDLQLSDDRRAFTGMGERMDLRVITRWGLESGVVMSERQLEKRLGPMVVDRFDYRGLVGGGRYLNRLDQVRRPSKRPDGSIDFGRVDLVLEDWVTQAISNRFELPAYASLAVDGTPDGKVLAGVVADDWTLNYDRGGTRGSVYLIVWDLEKDVERFRVVRNRKTYFTAFSLVAIAPDGSLVATVSERNQLEVWDGATGELLNQFKAGSIVTVLEFSDDGERLASGQQDGSVLVWDTRSAVERATR